MPGRCVVCVYAQPCMVPGLVSQRFLLPVTSGSPVCGDGGCETGLHASLAFLACQVPSPKLGPSCMDKQAVDAVAC